MNKPLAPQCNSDTKTSNCTMMLRQTTATMGWRTQQQGEHQAEWWKRTNLEWPMGQQTQIYGDERRSGGKQRASDHEMRTMTMMKMMM